MSNDSPRAIQVALSDDQLTNVFSVNDNALLLPIYQRDTAVAPQARTLQQTVERKSTSECDYAFPHSFRPAQ